MRGPTASPTSAVRRAPFTGAVLKFLEGCRPRPNASPEEVAHRQAMAISKRLLQPDPERAAAVRRVARRRRIPIGYVRPERAGPDAEGAGLLRARAAALGEALELEGILPRGWGELDAFRWRRDAVWWDQGPAALPHEMAALATWAPAVERLRVLHADFAEAADAWGQERLPADFSVATLRPHLVRNRHVFTQYIDEVDVFLSANLDEPLVSQRADARNVLREAGVRPPSYDEFCRLVEWETNRDTYEYIATWSLWTEYLSRLAIGLNPARFDAIPNPGGLLVEIWSTGVPPCSMRPSGATYLLAAIDATEPLGEGA